MPGPYDLDIELQEYHPLESPPVVGEERYEILPAEVNDIVNKHNALQSVSNPKWEPDYAGLRCWYPGIAGIPIDYYRDPTATDAELGAVAPGAGGSKWVEMPGAPGTGTGDVTRAELASSTDNVVINGGVF